MNRNLIRIIPWLVSGIGVLVMVGWWAHFDPIVYVFSLKTSMRFLAAFLFLLTGNYLHLVRRWILFQEDCLASHLTVFASMIFVIAFTSLVAGIFPLLRPIFSAVHSESWETIPGMPAIGTLIGFLIISSILIPLALEKWIKPYFVISGTVIMLIGFTAVLGNIFDIEWMVYTTRWSGGMATHTAFLFIMIGWYLILISRNPLMNRSRDITHSVRETI